MKNKRDNQKNKGTKFLIYLGIIVVLIGVVIVTVNAQVISGRINRLCGTTTADIIVDLKNHTELNPPVVRYYVGIFAGRCEKEVKGEVNYNINSAIVINNIKADIASQINTRNITLYPSPYEDNEIDGRFNYTLT